MRRSTAVLLLLPACYATPLTADDLRPGDDDSALGDDDTTAADDDSSAGDDDATPGDDDSGPSDDDSASGDDDGDPGDDDTVPEDDCTEASRLVYVIDRDTSTLHSFQPATGALVAVGVLDCSSWGEPNSMGVTRDGLAFVRYSDNEVYEVDLFTADCGATGYSDGGFGAFGMGYAATPLSTTLDTLFVANEESLAVLDTGTWSLTTVGPMPSQAELTGNNLGELWAFLPLESPPVVASISASNAAVLGSAALSGLPAAEDIDTFAFAWWGGSLWIFLREYGMGNSSGAYQVNPATGAMTLVHADLGINIVGAGVSTCAPVTAR